MRVELIPLDALRAATRGTGKPEFVEKYPGLFLLAMGFVSAELLSSARKKGETCALAFGQHLRHDPSQVRHPLSGHAFFLRGGSGLPAAPSAARGPGAGGDEVTLGRGAGCDVTIPEASVSDQHCRIRVTDRGVGAVDLGSRNGTSVNLTRLAPGELVLLGDEDLLTLGRYSFQVMTSATLYNVLGLLEALSEP
jgi:hypothetical protein